MATKKKSSNKITFTDLALSRLNPPNKGQRLLWDQGCKGLSLLISPGGTKTFRVLFKLGDKYLTATLGRYGEVTDDDQEDANITWARDQARKWRKLARDGKDPRDRAINVDAGKVGTFEHAVTEYIEGYCKDHQRRWNQTEYVLRNNCAAFLNKPMVRISKGDVLTLLRSMRETPGKQAQTYAWLKAFWKWAWQNDLAPSDLIGSIPFKRRHSQRQRVFSDDEIKAIWSAANSLDPVLGGYFKLNLLLAPRKTALAMMRGRDLNADLTLWTTPHEFTKSRKSAKPRKYLTPLPALARRILKGLTIEADAPVFPNLPIHVDKAGNPCLSARVTRALIKAGAPSDFTLHALRHTLATWLENLGHSEWERGLLLNHSKDGVTEGYSHGYPLELKRKMLDNWAERVERLVGPEGAVVLR
jgi:integrase